MIYVDEHIDEFDLQQALWQISPQRRAEALKFKFERGQRTCVLAYLLLKRGLKEEYGITENPVFEYGEHGKPSMADHPEIHFNFSHCKEAVACALSNHPIGIDVESVGRYSESVARYAMNDEELGQIMKSERPDIAFTRLWTMKEARLKLTGEGINDDIKNVLVGNPYRFTTEEHLDKGYILTVCENNLGS